MRTGTCYPSCHCCQVGLEVTFVLWLRQTFTCCFLLELVVSSAALHTETQTHTHTHKSGSALQAWVQVLPLFDVIRAKSCPLCMSCAVNNVRL